MFLALLIGIVLVCAVISWALFAKLAHAQHGAFVLNGATIVRCALVAALYTAVCLALAPFSYGAIQVRLSEALCLLPIFGPEYIVGVTLGCFLSNLLGSGIIDVVFGTLATLFACVCTYSLRHLRTKSGLAILPSLPPVLFNALIVGPEIAIFFSDAPATLAVMLFNGVTVGIGEIISCTIAGVALAKVIESTPALRALFTKN